MTEFSINAGNLATDEQQEFIFKSFANLNPDESLVVGSDHDSFELVMKLKSAFGKLLEYEYIERGPQNWKVRLLRKRSEGCCGFCN